MMELPCYSSQLMQQLWALRKEGHFCDCTILVGDSPHPAHKVVLAASSMLFRSLLDSSDTISIDTALVTSQEFGCLLDMVYTGKLPLGKHNVSRIVSAADNLQMFDVAVGFKNVLTSLVNQQPPVPVHSTLSSNLSVVHEALITTPEGSASSNTDTSTSNEAQLKKTEHQGDSNETDEPLCKKTSAESSGPKEAKLLETVEENHNTAATSVEHSSQFGELLTNMSSVLKLLCQVEQDGLDEQERQVLCQCSEEGDPKSAVEKLMSRVNEGQLSKAGLFKLLRTVQQNTSCLPPSLLSLLKEKAKEIEMEMEEKSTQETNIRDESEQQSGTRSEEEKEGEDEENGKETADDDKDIKDTRDSHSTTPSASPSTPFSCHWCKKGFAYKCRMLSHVKRCSMSQECEKQCPQCHKKLANLKALQRHRAEAHHNTARIKKKVACDLCGRTFAHPSGMIYHKRTEHFEEKPFTCEKCGAKFGAKSSLKNHMRLHTGEKPYCCNHCDMSFSVAAALAYHTKKKHSEGKMYVCQYCKATFAQSIELTRHVRTHTGDRPYVCRECGKGYSQASGLTVHLQNFHNLSEPHDCQKCCLSFSSLEEHQQHIQDFHPKDFHKCPTCNKVFTSTILLDKHKGTHTGAKPFSCDICNKSYQQLSGLWYHNRTNHPDVFASHTRQLKTLVQCDNCFRFFPSATSLAKHQASEHQGSTVSVVQCPYCPAVVGVEEELQKHISSQHISQCREAFGCQLCSLVYASKLELQDHLLSCPMQAQKEQEAGEKVSTSLTVISGDPTGNEGVVSVISEEQEVTEQVFVALAGGAEGRSSTEVVEINMYDLLNNSVTFICEDKPSGS